jgi:hypothetical protein
LLPPLSTVFVLDALLALLTAASLRALGPQLVASDRALAPLVGLFALHLYTTLRSLTVVRRVSTGHRRLMGRLSGGLRLASAGLLVGGAVAGAEAALGGLVGDLRYWALLATLSLAGAWYAWSTSPSRR